jgi:hypothetical protein
LSDTSAAVETRSRKHDASKPNGKRRPRAIGELDRRTCDLDRRSLEFKRYEEVRSAVIRDLGGEDVVSTAEAQITDKAAFIAMKLEQMQIAALSGETIDLQRYGELTDRLRRLLESVGLSRRAKDITPSLAEYATEVRRRAQDAPNADQEPAA